ncbi:DUF2079 domain-containing protein [Patescibacteria group bacterium]|nr:DUF2079 domain-containing protein [Patescibacteria group bacterium]
MKRKVFLALKENILLLVLVLFSLFFIALNIKMNIFSYNNFDFGKFDLGNMTQMVWNTLQGRILYVTDYFGTNMPRWGMSHVDPILLLFVPIFFFYQHPLTLVFSQIILVAFTSVILFLLSNLILKNKLVAFLVGMSFLFYPSVGYLTARTGFHGVTPAMFFFVLAFYILEVAYEEQDFSKKRLIWFWILLVITMSGKEQISLYMIPYGIFIWLFRGKQKLGLWVASVGAVWFMIAFFVIIPAFANYRIDGYKKFADTIGMDPEYENEVTKDNYFLGRYAEFGDTYLEVAFNMVTHPAQLAQVFLSGDKPQNFRETFTPVGFLPFLAPTTFFMAIPDLIINYSTTSGGVGTSEIYNHRISMIVPVLFISSIFALHYMSEFFSKRQSKISYKVFSIVFAGIFFSLNVYTSFSYENPVYLWATQSIRRRVLDKVFARTVENKKELDKVKIGDLVDLPSLNDKDRECAAKIVNLIPKTASVSGPDYLGAHLSMRETYAIFPALYNETDFVIVDVFAQKLNRILGVNIDMVGNTVEELIISDEHKLVVGCGNLFVYANIGKYPKDKRLPIQERYEYEPKFEYELLDSLYVIDSKVPSQTTRGVSMPLEVVYNRRSGRSLNGFVLYTSFVHEETGELYQVASLASLSLYKLDSWTSGLNYIETQEIVIPEFMPSGEYKVFLSTTNKINTRNLYIDDLKVL